ncbi:MAG: chromate efflux transporter [Pseudomonadota bacterium]
MGDATQKRPSLGEAAALWWRIGVLSFGGPAAQIALMQKALVEERGWLTEQQFLNALSFCMLLPGPEAMQLATYAGWRQHGIAGGLIAGLLFVLPGAAVIMALAATYASFGTVPLVEALFYGIKAAVLVIVAEALLRLSRKALLSRTHYGIAVLAFISIFFLAIPYPLILLAAALIGTLTLDAGQNAAQEPGQPVAFVRTMRTIITWLAIWFAPFLALFALGTPEILIDIGLFFSTLAAVGFGGAYAVLAYMSQDAVAGFNWLTAREMIDALALAETTPGPLILVTQFVSFIAGFKEGGIVLGFTAACVVLWVTFVPCFLWIFAGAPYIAWISNQPRLRNALSGITAAVVGIIFNLSLWFALHVFFNQVSQERFGWLTFWQPELASIEYLATALFLVSAFLAFRYKWGIPMILVFAALSGALIRLVMSSAFAI